ncbi:MAG: fatty acid desaturase family protein [Pseudobdellovibrionaceae bacterium]
MKIEDSFKQEIKVMAERDALRSVFAYLMIFFSVIIAGTLAEKADSFIVTFLVIVFIGGRQHALYILNHESSHFNLFKGRKWNVIVSSFLANDLLFHHPEAWSFEMWKRVHNLHHKNFFTEKDLNYLGRELRGDTISPISRNKILLGMLLAGPRAFRDFFFGKQDWVSPDGEEFNKGGLSHLQTLFKKFHGDTVMEKERIRKLLVMSSLLFIIFFAGYGKMFFIYWITPMYLSFPAILYMKDLTEHYWAAKAEPGDLKKNTASTKPGVIEKFFFADLNRGLHREHHFYPSVPFFRLKKLSQLLIRKGILDNPKASFLKSLPREWE